MKEYLSQNSIFKYLNNFHYELILLFIFIIYYGGSVLFNDPILIDAKNDYLNFIKPSVEVFNNEDFFTALMNYPGAFGPLYVIFLGLLNKFLTAGFVVLINIIITFLAIFFLWLSYSSIVDKDLNFRIILIIMLSPFLKASTIELNTDHFAIFFFSIAIYFLFNSSNKNKIFNYVISLFFASLSVYTRQSFLGFNIALVIYYIYKNNFKSILISIFIAIVIIFPLVFLFIFWGGLVNPFMRQSHIPAIYNSTVFSFVSLNFLLYLFFYILIFNIKKSIKYFNSLFKNKWKTIILILIFIVSIILSVNFNFDRLNQSGGGIFLKTVKFSNLYMVKYFLLFLFHFLFFVSIFLLYENSKNLIYLIIILLSICPFYFNLTSFSKYFDPFLFILLFSFYLLICNKGEISVNSLFLLIVFEIFINIAFFISNI